MVTPGSKFYLLIGIGPGLHKSSQQGKKFAATCAHKGKHMAYLRQPQVGLVRSEHEILPWQRAHPGLWLTLGVLRDLFRKMAGEACDTV